MKVAVLIGFSYGEDNETLYIGSERNPLPGIVVDLYQAYVASVNMDAQKIIVVTDIIKDQPTSVLRNAIVDSAVDSDILNFIENIKDNDVYHHFIGRDDLMKSVNIIISGADEVFIYYTGHVSRGFLLFPFSFFGKESESNVSPIQSNNGRNTYGCHVTMIDGRSQYMPCHEIVNHLEVPIKTDDENSKLSLIDLRMLILTSVDKYAEVFLVMDCCNGNGLGLPFHLQDNVYRLTNSEPRIYTTQKVICLSSTMFDENSITSRDGSIFTRSLFKQMKERQQSIQKMLEVVGKECLTKYAQTATVHASYPDLKILWNWVYGPTNLSIIIDCQTNTLIVDFVKSTWDEDSPTLIGGLGSNIKSKKEKLSSRSFRFLPYTGNGESVCIVQRDGPYINL